MSDHILLTVNNFNKLSVNILFLKSTVYQNLVVN